MYQSSKVFEEFESTMATKSERRQFVNMNNNSHDPYVGLDINEYLIEEWPTLNLRQRRAVWARAQNEDLIDLSSIEDQVDQIVLENAERDPTIDLSAYDFEVDDDDEED